MRLYRRNEQADVPKKGTHEAALDLRAKTILTTTALFTAGMLSACGDVNNYYYGNDTSSPAACQSGPQLVCGDKPVQSYVRVGQTLDIGESHFKVVEVGDEGLNGVYAILEAQDPDCFPAATIKIYRDQPSTELASVLGNYKVTLLGTYQPDGRIGGAVLQVEANCPGTEPQECTPSTVLPTCSSEIVSGILNQGESLQMATFKVQLDDLTNEPTGVYAIVSILDSENNTLNRFKIKEGDSVTVVLDGVPYVIKVNTVAPGYTFGAKWADISVSICESSSE